MRKPKSGSADPKPSDETLPSAGSSASKSSGDYEVGYGKPPKNTRFVKGRSGNPKGSKRNQDDPSAEFRKIMEQKVEVVVNGKKKRVRTDTATSMALTNKAMSGNVSAKKHLDALCEKDKRDQAAKEERDGVCAEEDKANVQHLLERTFAGFRNSTAGVAEIPEGAKTPENTAGPVEPQDSEVGESPTERGEDGGTADAGGSAVPAQQAGDGIALAPAVNGPQGLNAAAELTPPRAARRGRTTSSTYLQPVSPSSGFDLSPRQAVAGFPIIHV